MASGQGYAVFVVPRLPIMFAAVGVSMQKKFMINDNKVKLTPLDDGAVADELDRTTSFAERLQKMTGHV